jgi:hypothetical protein
MHSIHGLRQTPMKTIDIVHKGSQWAIYIATHVYGVSLRDYRLKQCNEK